MVTEQGGQHQREERRAGKGEVKGERQNIGKKENVGSKGKEKRKGTRRKWRGDASCITQASLLERVAGKRGERMREERGWKERGRKMQERERREKGGKR